MADKDSFLPVPFLRTTGRPKVDWDTLLIKYQEMEVDIPIGEFLRTYGIDYKARSARQATREWSDRTIYHSDVEPDKPEDKVPRMHISEAKAKTILNQDLPPVIPIKVQLQPGLWEKVQQWRSTQAISDYETAEALRSHVKLYINQQMKKDKNGKVVGSRMRAIEVAHIGKALLDIQKVQRLALGMSTENVGVNNPAEAVASEVDRTADDVPIFAVEVNKNGKFVRPRPRKISGGE